MPLKSSPRTAVLGLVLALGLGACSGGTQLNPTCRKDSDCADTQVCFTDGCGDPGDELIIEVTPQTQSSAAQEFVIKSVQGQQDLTLQSPTLFTGQVAVAGPTVSTPFVGSLTVSGVGKSLNIPGVDRRFRSKVTPDKGAFSVTVPAGSYSVSVSPDDSQVPPFIASLDAFPGQTQGVSITLADPQSLVHIRGRLLTAGNELSGDGLAIQATTADDAGTVLSQSATLADGGTFDVALSPHLDAGTQIQLTLLSSLESTSFIPQKSFLLSPIDQLFDLDLGGFGNAFSIQGRALDGSGKAVANASVHLEGTVEGGGNFRSEIAKTDADGKFEVQTLAAARAQALTLWVVPDVSDLAGILFAPLTVQKDMESLEDVTCPARVLVKGNVLLPGSSSPALGVSVSAVPVEAVPGQPLPSQTHTAVTDSQGAFTLHLDPAIYRLDFQAVSALPRTSLFQRVARDGASVVSVGSVVLANGHTIQGTILQGSPSATPVGRATVRFFRRDRYGDSPVVRPLAETYTDDLGAYSVSIPSE